MTSSSKASYYLPGYHMSEFILFSPISDMSDSVLEAGMLFVCASFHASHKLCFFLSCPCLVDLALEALLCCLGCTHVSQYPYIV